MTASDATALILATVASALGAIVVVSMWRRSRRRRRAVRSRHPSVRPPLVVGYVDEEPWSRICIDVPAGAPEVAVDIVAYRRARPPGPWDSEPLDAPRIVAPGGRAVLAATLPAGSAADVVVAWTAHHATGPVQGSRLFRLPADREVPVTAPLRSGTLAGRPAAALLVLLLAAAAVVAVSWRDRDGARADDQRGTPPAASGPDTAPQPTTEVTVATTHPVLPPGSAASTPSSSTTVAASTPATSASATTAPVTTVPTTTVPVVATSTVTPATSVATGPQVVADARRGPCRFGDDCLIVGFTIAGFAGAPQEYVCEFEDGSRFTFRFDSGGVVDACATGSAAAAITVEVDGVRSATVTRADAG